MIVFESVPKFQLFKIVLTVLFLNLGMFWFLSTYETNLKLGYIYVEDMLKFFIYYLSLFKEDSTFSDQR